MSIFPDPVTYTDSVSGAWIDFSGITAVWVCARCGLQGGAWFNTRDARSDAARHRRAEHANAKGDIDWDLHTPGRIRNPEGKHGTTNLYRNKGCRCTVCKQAIRDEYLTKSEGKVKRRNNTQALS